MDVIGQREEVCASKSVQLWRGIVNWLGFLFQLIVQILRGTPSTAQMLLSYLISSSSSFKPLPVVEISLPQIEPAPPQITISTEPIKPDACDSRVDKFTVVLDLDETLVCAYETGSLPASIRTVAIQAGLKWFELECISPDKVCLGKTKVNHVTVFERPGLHEFLDQLNEFADLVLFTAGLEGYARPLVDKIDTKKRFSLCLYRPSTVSMQHREHVKDLSCLSKNLCRIVIVDNNPFSFLLQPSNGIPCVPFSAAQPHDNQLLDVILPLLKTLSMEKDVRPILYERFHMPEWFRMRGIPTPILE